MNLPAVFSGMLCTVLLLRCPVAASDARELYVAPNGWDRNPGTRAAPLRTIGRAGALALPGTTVHVAAGTYAGGFKTTASGTAVARIGFVSSTRWGARIVPPVNSASSMAWHNRGDYVDIVGFEVDGSAWQGGTAWRSGIYSAGSHDAIRNNRVHHIGNTIACTSAGGAGIALDGYFRGTGSEASGNSVHDIGRPGCRFIHGIYVSTSGTVSNNTVYRIGEAGIHLWHDAREVLVSNNTVAASNTGIVVGGGDFYHTAGPNDRTRVVNNIVYDNQRGIVEHGATGKGNTYSNNLVFQNALANWRLRNGLAHSATVEAAPRFMHYTRTGTPDFRLGAASPAIGRGTAPQAQVQLPGALAGAPAEAGQRYDIGARPPD